MEILAPVHLFEGCETPLPLHWYLATTCMHEDLGGSSSGTPWGYIANPGSHPAPRTSTSPCLEMTFFVSQGKASDWSQFDSTLREERTKQ